MARFFGCVDFNPRFPESSSHPSGAVVVGAFEGCRVKARLIVALILFSWDNGLFG